MEKSKKKSIVIKVRFVKIAKSNNTFPVIVDAL